MELALRYQNRQMTGLLGRSTALIGAAVAGHTLVVEQLIAAGAGLDVQNGNGYGPWADCGNDCMGRTLLNPANGFLAGAPRSSGPP
jgi:hypothetical protein